MDQHQKITQKAVDLFNLPFFELIDKAHQIHKENFDPNQVQLSSLLSIKTGNCPEDCAYCPQSAKYNKTKTKEEHLEIETVLCAAKKAKEGGATRFCMGAAGSDPKQRDMPYLVELVKKVKEMGLETCMTLGALDKNKANELASAGLDYYNHNIDTSENFYHQIITTRGFKDRIETLENVQQAGMKVCSGGILGMGEEILDRAKMLATLATLETHPQSVPINMLVKSKNTPLANVEDLDSFDFIRTIAVARILLPKSYVRLSAGRSNMSDECQAFCFFAGANSIFYGDKLLTTKNVEFTKDKKLFARLNMSCKQKSKACQEETKTAKTLDKALNINKFYEAA